MTSSPPGDAPRDTVEEKLNSLGFELPVAMEPISKYRHVLRDGQRLILSGHGPFVAGKQIYKGKVGREYTIHEGYEANRLVGLRILRTLKDELGTLDRVERPLFQNNYVNVVPDFEEGDYFDVGNGSIDLWIALWGDDIGRCARMTFGVVDLPRGVPTAISSWWKIKDD